MSQFVYSNYPGSKAVCLQTLVLFTLILPVDPVHTTIGKRVLNKFTKTRTGPKDVMCLFVYSNQSFVAACTDSGSVYYSPIASGPFECVHATTQFTCTKRVRVMSQYIRFFAAQDDKR